MPLAPRRTRRRPAPVVAVKPHPLVYREARRLAGGDLSRLVIESSTSILVRNR